MMDRFTIVVDEKLGMAFRVAAVKRRMKLNLAFKEAMELWLEKV
jgi:hypothetical protein